MKTLFLLFASAALLSAEELKPAALPAQSTCTDGSCQIRFDGTKQLALDFPLKLKPGNWYRIQFDARSRKGAGADRFLSALRFGGRNRYQAFQANTAWSRHVNFFYAQEADGQYSLILKRSQAGPDTVEFREIRCTGLDDADFRRNLFPDGDFESGDPAVPSFPWRKGGTAEVTDCGFLRVFPCSAESPVTAFRSLYDLRHTSGPAGKTVQTVSLGQSKRKRIRLSDIRNSAEGNPRFRRMAENRMEVHYAGGFSAHGAPDDPDAARTPDTDAGLRFILRTITADHSAVKTQPVSVQQVDDSIRSAVCKIHPSGQGGEHGTQIVRHFPCGIKRTGDQIIARSAQEVDNRPVLIRITGIEVGFSAEHGKTARHLRNHRLKTEPAEPPVCIQSRPASIVCERFG